MSTLKVGYREMGTASVYDNEKEVGRAVEGSWVASENPFIQTKLLRSFVGQAKVEKSKFDSKLRKSLEKLEVNRDDLGQVTGLFLGDILTILLSGWAWTGPNWR